MAKYLDFLVSLPANCRSTMPSPREACYVLHPLRSAIEEESGSARDDDDLFKYAIHLLPEVIAEWQAERVNRIDELISAYDLAHVTQQPELAVFNPEALVFKCCHQFLYGRKEMLAHHCSLVQFCQSTKCWRFGPETQPTIDVNRSRHLHSLIVLAGVDNVQDLNLLDPRIVCVTCPVKYRDRVPGRTAMTWRQCVGWVSPDMGPRGSSHPLQLWHCDYLCGSGHPYSVKIIEWQLLSAEETTGVRAREVLHQASQDAWACAHCTAHLEVQLVLDQVCLHLKQQCVFGQMVLFPQW
jgi:hypothetical protein